MNYLDYIIFQHFINTAFFYFYFDVKCKFIHTSLWLNVWLVIMRQLGMNIHNNRV